MPFEVSERLHFDLHNSCAQESKSKGRAFHAKCYRAFVANLSFVHIHYMLILWCLSLHDSASLLNAFEWAGIDIHFENKLNFVLLVGFFFFLFFKSNRNAISSFSSALKAKIITRETLTRIKIAKREKRWTGAHNHTANYRSSFCDCILAYQPNKQTNHLDCIRRDLQPYSIIFSRVRARVCVTIFKN